MVSGKVFCHHYSRTAYKYDWKGERGLGPGWGKVSTNCGVGTGLETKHASTGGVGGKFVTRAGL